MQTMEMVVMRMARRPFRKDPTLRTARIVYLLSRGKKLTTQGVADLCGITYSGAWYMMMAIESSEYVPVACIDGWWQMLDA